MNLAPCFRQQFFDSNGDPLAGGFIYTYQAGTTTPLVTYTDASGDPGSENENPIELDASGSCRIWLDPTLSYKFVITDADDNPIGNEDGIVGIVEDDAVPTNAIQDDAVTADKLRDSVGTDSDRAVTSNHIRNNAITGAAGGGKLAYSAVNGQTAETAPAADDELLLGDTSASGLKKITKGDFEKVAVSASKTTTYTATGTDRVIPCSASGGAWTLTLPAAASHAGRMYTFIKTDSTFNAVTLDGNASETIDGATTKKLCTQYDTRTIVSDGSNWFTVARNYPKQATAYTLTIGATTSAPSEGSPTKSAYWARVGDNLCRIHYQFRAATGTGSTGTGNYLFPFPSGITADTTLAPTPSVGGSQQCFGHGAIYNGANYAETHTYLADATQFYMFIPSTGGVVSSGAYQINASEIQYSFDAVIPVSGWE
jgi:hypothetical protein